MRQISWEQLWAWWVYDHESVEAQSKEEFMLAQVAAEVHNVPIRMGFVSGELRKTNEYMIPSWDERRLERERNEKNKHQSGIRGSIEEWRLWKESLKKAGARKAEREAVRAKMKKLAGRG